MVIRAESAISEMFEKLCGGEGYAIKKDLVNAVKPSNVKLFSEIILSPGDSVGSHTHYDESEMYYIINGDGEYEDNGEKIRISTGDCTVCLSGGSHGLKNVGKDNLKMLAVIVLA